MKAQFILALLFSFIFPVAWASSPLQPIKLDSPRDTMKSYLTAINDYKKGLETGDDALISRLGDAARCFNLKDVPFLIRKEKSHQSAIFIKEVIDRIILIDFEKIPDRIDIPRWRLKDTEIVIALEKEGDRAGEYLFSSDTTFRAEDFFKKVKSLPYLKGSQQGAGYKEPWLKSIIPQWAQDKIIGLAKWQWIGILAATFLGFIVKVLVEFLILIFKKLSPKEETSFRKRILEALDKPLGLIAASIVWFLSVHFLKIEGMAAAVLISVVQIIGSLSVVWACYRFTDVLTSILGKVADKTESDLDDQLVPLVSKSLRVFVIVVGVLATIQNLGFNVMSLVAGLGLGGLAFALAAKDTAANLFGSIMIILDRPFKIGDWVIAGKVEGTVEDIGFRSTRLRTFYNSQISIPNSELATISIDNMGRREFRRVRADLGLAYDTTPERLQDFVSGIKTIINEHPCTRKDYFHVVFNGYEDSSLNIMVYFFLKVPDWAEELKQKEDVNLKILKLSKTVGVSFAFPSQSIYVESFPSSKESRI